MYTVHFEKKFKKAYKKLKSNKNFKLEIFKFVVNELRNDRELDVKYKDHELLGDYAGYRDCHIQNDVVLVYKKEKDILVLVLANIGSHSELF